MDKINKRKIEDKELDFSKLHQISTYYACTLKSNSFKRLTI
jgi:hypothetical protein